MMHKKFHFDHLKQLIFVLANNLGYIFNGEQFVLVTKW